MNKRSQPSESLNIPIRRFITKKLIGASKDSSIQEVAKRMCEFDIGSILVLNNDDVIGIVTDKDLKKRALGEGRSPKDSIQDIMTQELFTVDVNSTIVHALELMSEKRIKHLLVTDKGEIIGITTLTDLEHLDLQELETLIARD